MIYITILHILAQFPFIIKFILTYKIEERGINSVGVGVGVRSVSGSVTISHETKLFMLQIKDTSLILEPFIGILLFLWYLRHFVIICHIIHNS